MQDVVLKSMVLKVLETKIHFSTEKNMWTAYHAPFNYITNSLFH